MTEPEEQEEQELKFTAFHIVLFIISINLLLYGNIDVIIDIIFYIKNLNMLSVMVIIAHVLLVYFILSSIQFDIKFKATMKLTELV
jgi:hypothetical protein